MSRLTFSLGRDADLDTLLRRLEAAAGVEALAASPLRRTYFDTFDWHLWQGGLVLRCDELDARSSVVLAALDGPVRRRHRGGFAPGLAADLPPGPWRDQLGPLIGVRRLLPVVVLSGLLHRLAVRNEDGKIVARLEVLAPLVEIPGDPAPHRPAASLRLQALRGYGGATEELCEWLGDVVGVAPRRSDELTDALAAGGRAPGPRGGRAALPLDGNRPAAFVVRQLVGELCSVAVANLDGCRRDLDPEFLHDLRVAVRRCRALLRQLGEALPAAPRRRLEDELSWLGQVTGPPRDLDVFTARWRRAGECALPAELRGALEAQRAESHRELSRHLDSSRFASLTESWSRFSRGRGSGPAGETACLELATRRIWRAYRRVRKLGDRLIDAGRPGELHRLRIRCKRLRYLMELFRDLYRQEIAAAIRDLKRLQDQLGAHHDTIVQETLVRRTVARLEQGGAGVETALEAGTFLQRLRDERERIEAGFERSYRRFASAATDRRYRALFRGGAAG